MLAGEPDRRTAVGNARARDADAQAVLVGDFLRGALAASALRSTQTMCAPSFTSRCAVSLPMPEPAPIDDDDLPREFLLGRHALELRFLEQPVLDVERFLLRQRDVLVDRLGAAHDFDRAVVELGRDAGLGLVLAPGDHAQARDQHHGRDSGRASRASSRACTSRSTPRSPCDTLRARRRASSSAQRRSSVCGFQST